MKPFKLVIAGDSGTGKTSLLNRLIKDTFDFKTTSTNVTNNEKYDFHLDNDTIETDIWDLGGRDTLTNEYFHDADGVFLVYDITNVTSFENITGWLKNITQWVDPNTMIKLVGNKTDLHDQRTVSIQKAKLLSTYHGLTFIETSALNSNNVTITFEWMIQELCATIKNSDNSVFLSGPMLINRKKSVHNVFRNLIDVSDNKPHKDLAGLSFNDTQAPFHIVLIDLKKASLKYRPMIRCVKVPLSDPDLKYVAISYRWGELQETIIDTDLDYTATITSFDINDFYQLCRTIIKEKDMQDLDYVWVDAICINQTNYEQRKATIHQMSNIYDRAEYILAVPDLHKAHLQNTYTVNADIMNLNSTKSSQFYQKDLYHLIHGNIDQLERMEEQWLDVYKVPNDPSLRHLLKSSTNHFANSFITHRLHHSNYNPEKSLDHLYETSSSAAAATTTTKPMGDGITYADHDCDNLMQCPLDLYHNRQLPEWRETMIRHQTYNDSSWKQLVQERSHSIRRSMNFMKDLIQDWSSRVWVISEYNIAKKKNNMKYWFIQLGEIDDTMDDFTFFKFSFDNASFYNDIQQAFHHEPDPSTYSTNDPVYLTFHQMMLNQLDQQSFFEMILKSKASKHEDRFYAIFPQTEYKDMVTDKAQVDSWNINTLTMVKLKLYEIMTIRDKLNLLYISGNLSCNNLGEILPTFASSTINWDKPMDYFYTSTPDDYNFDVNDPSTITLCPIDDSFYLNIQPKEYFIQMIRSGRTFKKNPTLWKRLLPEGPNCCLCIPIMSSIYMASYNMTAETDTYWGDYVVYLIGHLEKNIWTMIRGLPSNFNNYFAPKFNGFEHHTSQDNHAGFNIY